MNGALHPPESELLEGLPEIKRSPADQGTLEAIVIRPAENERQSLEQCLLSPEGGTEGDAWARGCWLSLENGQPHPDVQIAIVNSRTMQLVAGSPDRWPLAGDNLYVDFDLSRENLKTGQRLQAGACLLEITEEEHTGCRKFVERFGKDAVQFVNSAVGKQLRLRGVYAKVIEAGKIHVGDRLTKV